MLIYFKIRFIFAIIGGIAAKKRANQNRNEFYAKVNELRNDMSKIITLSNKKVNTLDEKANANFKYLIDLGRYTEQQFNEIGIILNR